MPSTTADRRGWGSPGRPNSAQGRRYFRENVIKVSVAGISIWVHHIAAPQFKGFIEELVASGYPVHLEADDWGYNHRFIRGLENGRIPDDLSNHSWALAIDLNALRNPQLRGRLRTNMPVWIRGLADKWELEWGGTWKTRPDPMHFEIKGTPEDCRRFNSKLVQLADAEWKDEVEIKMIDRTKKALTELNPDVKTGGYWLVGNDGGVETIGAKTPFFGSVPGKINDKKAKPYKDDEFPVGLVPRRNVDGSVKGYIIVTNHDRKDTFPY